MVVVLGRIENIQGWVGVGLVSGGRVSGGRVMWVRILGVFWERVNEGWVKGEWDGKGFDIWGMI